MARKHANGEGSVYRRSDGRWGGAVSYIGADGKSKRQPVYGRTQAEARAKVRAVQDRLTAGQPVKDASVTVAAFIEDWIAKALAASSRKQSTKENYATVARAYVVPTLGHLRLDRLRPSDVESLIMTKRGDGLSASTVRTTYTVLRAALDVAVRDGLVSQNVSAKVKRPSVERRDAAFLTAEQAQALVEGTRDERLHALYVLMLATGLRRGEALALHWRDVDLEAGLLRVRWTLSRLSTGLELTEPKTEKSRRTIVLPVPGIEALRAHRKRQAIERLKAGAAWQDADLVFCTEAGGLLEPRNVLRRFTAISKRLGLMGVTLHTLRHSTASLLLASGTHTKVVQELLGHSSYAITADIYSHVAPAQQREAAERLGDALAW